MILLQGYPQFRKCLGRPSRGVQPMASQRRTSPQFQDSVTFYWTGGRNVTWRLTHDPTGMVIEGSTELSEAGFTKKRLRIAEEKLRAKLLEELERRVARRCDAAEEAG